ncbi:MAG: hypothetical protein IT437_10495 [Phycisphaerales bacterium]|nr:hypothetical protein [Phycisphaerales bacterium]
MVTGNDGSSQGSGRSRGVLAAEKSRLAGHLSEFSDAVRDSGRRLSGGDDNAISRLTGHAADSINHACNYLRTADLRDLVRDARQVARRRPKVFLGGALMGGLLFGRFLRSQPDGATGSNLPTGGRKENPAAATPAAKPADGAAGPGPNRLSCTSPSDGAARPGYREGDTW